MGWFRKENTKKGIELDVPPPPTITDEQPIPALGELDIPPIHSLDDSKIKENEFDIPLPEKEQEENDMPLFPELPGEDSSAGKDETQEEQISGDEIMLPPMPEKISTLPFEHYQEEDFPNEEEIQNTFKQKHRKIPELDRYIEIKPMQKPAKASCFISLSEHKAMSDDLEVAKTTTNDATDTTDRIESIQQNKTTRYDRLQQDFEVMHKYFAKLELMIYANNSQMR